MQIEKNELVEFEFQQTNVSIVMIDDEPWFMAKEVAEILGYSNSRTAIADNVEAGDMQIILMSFVVGNPRRMIINEFGLYSLILSSRLPEARTFKHWIIHEVLPSLRKTGSYSLSNAPEAQLLREIQRLNEINRRTNEKLDILIAQNQQKKNEKQNKKKLPSKSMPDAEKLMIIETIAELAKEGEQVRVWFPEMHKLIKKKYGSDFFPPRPTAFLKSIEPELREKGISLLNIGKKIRRKKEVSEGFVIVTVKSYT